MGSGVQGSTFMYLYHLISIDLQLSRSFNSHTLQSLHLSIFKFCAVILLSGYNDALATFSRSISRLKGLHGSHNHPCGLLTFLSRDHTEATKEPDEVWELP